MGTDDVKFENGSDYMGSQNKLKNRMGYITPEVSAVIDFSDDDLIKGYVDGGKEVYLHALFEKHTNKLFAICKRYLGNDHDAQDLLQDTFLKITNSLNKGKEIQTGRFENRASTVARNTCLDEIKKRNKNGYMSGIEAIPNEGFEQEEDFSEAKIKFERIQSIIQGFDKEKDRKIATLKFIEGMTNRDIATYMSTEFSTFTEGAIKQKSRSLKNRILRDYKRQYN